MLFHLSYAIRSVSIEQDESKPRRHHAFETVRWNLQMRRTFHVLSIALRFLVSPHRLEDACIFQL